ncbi:MAG: hypothetical protein ACXVBE_05830 [Bdellovibrionota bacterium]
MGVPRDKVIFLDDASSYGFAKFEAVIKDSVGQLAHEEKPELFLAIHSHGNSRGLYTSRAAENEVSYSRLNDSIVRSVLAHPGLSNRLRIHFCLDACHSFSFFDYTRSSPAIELHFSASTDAHSASSPFNSHSIISLGSYTIDGSNSVFRGKEFVSYLKKTLSPKSYEG